MTAAILGLGTAVPARSIAQREAEAEAARLSGMNAEQSRTLAALYRRSGVQSRGSVVLRGAEEAPFFPPSAEPAEMGPGTGERLAEYARHATPLASRACDAAIVQAGIPADRITHLVTVSCTGFFAPGVDAELIPRLGLRPDVQRVQVGFMGCHGAVNGLRVAKALVAEDPAAVVLVCAVELCTLHYHYGDDPGKIVANALFADGAAACVIGQGTGSHWSLAATGSRLIEGSADAMTWRIGNHGFEMTLSARVPDLIREHLPAWLTGWLAGQGLSLKDIGCWAIHPGGPRVISTVAECLGLESGATAASRAVLSEHGNMSSPTLLFILSRLMREGARGAGGERGPCVALGFGPGLAVEGALFAGPR